jgi:hypothetical protein
MLFVSPTPNRALDANPGRARPGCRPGLIFGRRGDAVFPEPSIPACPIAARPRFSRFVPLFFLIAIGLFFLLPQSRGAVQFDVFAGYGDVVPEAGWFPVVAEIKNDGPPFTATFEISPGQFNQSQTRRVQVELPTNTRKRIVVPVFSVSRNGVWDFRLLDEKNTVRQQQLSFTPRRQTPSDTYLIGALARTMAGVPALPEGKALNRYQTYDVQALGTRILPALFPDNPLALEGLSAIYLNSSVALELNVQQVSALRLWLEQGGRLIVGVEQISDVTGNPWLAALMPCDLKSVNSIRLAGELQNWVRSKGNSPGSTGPQNSSRNRPGNQRFPNAPAGPRATIAELTPPDPKFDDAEMPVITTILRDGRTLVSAKNTPLIIEAPRGRGRITVFTFNPEMEPFVSWKNKPWFWGALAGLDLQSLDNYSYRQTLGWSADGIFGALIDSKQIHKLPLAWLLLLLVVYLLVIGPLDQHWLKKINRQMLTWITFPIYVVLFSGLIYFIGYKLRAGETEYNEVHVVDVLPSGPQSILRGRTFCSIYSPANTRYRLAGEQPFASIRGEFLSNFGGRGEESSRANILQHGNNFTAEVFVPVWTSQLFVSDWLQPAATPLDFRIFPQPGGGGFEVTVENSLDQKVSAARVVINGRIFELGELMPKQSRTFKLSPNQGSVLRDFVHSNGGTFFDAVQRRRNTFGENQVELNGPLTAMAASFLTLLNDPQQGYRNFTATPGLDLSALVDSGNAVLLAWMPDASLTKPQDKFSSRRHHRDTLLRVTTPLNNL